MERGILRIDTTRRVVNQAVEPSSPQPSVDRLSVSFAPEERSWSDFSEFNVSLIDAASKRLSGASGMAGANEEESPGKTQNRLSAALTDEDDDYSASMTAILHRRASQRKIKGVGKRRTSSPIDSERRRSSVFTTSSGDTAITMDGDGPATQDQIFEQLRLHKEVLESVKQQPWEMRRKLKLVQQAKAYVRRHEGQLQERLAQSKSTKDIMARFNLILVRYLQHLRREGANLSTFLTPWELRIKEIESHFGSVVASYFTFLRWVFWINIIISAIFICFIIVPEYLAADPAQSGQRKILLPSEERTATHLGTLWDFEGILKYSPLFYGYYTDQRRTKEGFPLPLSYFMTGLGVYVYSFVAILRRMAANSRQSKLSEKEDECIFSWKIFTGWDYMIGNPETAFNRFASITMGFKEALLEEKEKKKDERNWKVIGLRVLANFLIFLLLCLSAYAVILVVERSAEAAEDASWWRQNEITLVMSLITTVFPNIFELIGMLEKYHPRKQLRWQLARIMALNFLNLYTLIFALFGKVSTMTDELQALKFNVSMTTIPPPFESYPLCTDVSVNCSFLEDHASFMSVKETKTTVVFIANLSTPHFINGVVNTGNWFNNATGKFNVTDLLGLLFTLNPNGETGLEQLLNATANMSPDLSEYWAEIIENENFTYYNNGTENVNLNDTSIWIPNNKSSLIAALPIMLKLINMYLANTIPPLLGGRTPPIDLNLSNMSFSTEEDLNSTTESIIEDLRRRRDAEEEEEDTSSRPFESSDYTEPDWTHYEEEERVLDIGSGRGERNPDTELKSSTRGDIPGDIPGEDTTTSTTTTSTTTDPTTTTVFPEVELDKFLTKIITVFTMIFAHNSTKLDEPDVVKIRDFSKWITTLESVMETKKATPSANSSQFGMKLGINKEDKDSKKCFVTICEDGTTTPKDLFEYFNCSDLNCTMRTLLGPRNDTCWVPNSRLCIKPPPPPPTIDPTISIKLRRLCWETMFGQELVKLTVMDLIFTVGFILVLDFIRAILVRILNPCWCWDLEKQFPQYGDFKIAENILHLVNNQGMIWMGMFFCPGLPAINLFKLVMLMYIRSWAVMTCNVPHETVFRASRSNNFYFALLLFMLFLCTLPVGYAVVWLEPSWHCGPFSHYQRIYYIFTGAIVEALPKSMHKVLDYIASPGIVIPLLVLLVLIIYYLLSLTGALREANNDLKIQLRRERTEERRKMFKLAGNKKEAKPMDRWKLIMPVTKSTTPSETKPSVLTTGKQTGFAGAAKRAALKAKSKQEEEDGNATDVDQASLPEDNPKKKPQIPARETKETKVVKETRKPSCTDSIASIRSEIPVIKISKEEDSKREEKGKETPQKPEPTKKQKILKAIIDKAKKDRSQKEQKETPKEIKQEKMENEEFNMKKEEMEKPTESSSSSSMLVVNLPINESVEFVESMVETVESVNPILVNEINDDDNRDEFDSEESTSSYCSTSTLVPHRSSQFKRNKNESFIPIEDENFDIRPFFVRFQSGIKDEGS